MSIKTIGDSYQVNGKQLQVQYKDHISDYHQWTQLPHAHDYILFKKNMEQVFFMQFGNKIKELDYQKLNSYEATIQLKPVSRDEVNGIMDYLKKKGVPGNYIINDLIGITSIYNDPQEYLRDMQVPLSLFINMD